MKWSLGVLTVSTVGVVHDRLTGCNKRRDRDQGERCELAGHNPPKLMRREPSVPESTLVATRLTPRRTPPV